MSFEFRVLRLDIPGEWSDGWLYKNHLVLWARTGDMFFVPTEILARRLRRMTTPGVRALADYLIFRTDWKVSEQFRRIIAVPGVEERFLAELSPDSESTAIELGDPDLTLIGSPPAPGVALDTAIYANRVYIGTTSGLFETRFDPNYPGNQNPLVPRLGYRIVSVSAGHSSVNSSANEEGLWFSQVHFGESEWWSDDEAGSASYERVAELSRGNSFASIHLLNYTDDAFPSFMRSESIHERPHDNAEYAEWRILGYHGAQNIRGLMTSVLTSSQKVRLSDKLAVRWDDADAPAEVLGNSDYRLLIKWRNMLKVVDIAAYEGRELEAKPDLGFGALEELAIPPSSILNTYAFGNSFLVELREEVRLINSHGSFPLIREPVARIRTFSKSRRYREVALLVRETGLSLVGFYTVTVPEF